MYTGTRTHLANSVEHLLKGIDQDIVQGSNRVLPLLGGLIGERSAGVAEEVV